MTRAGRELATTPIQRAYLIGRDPDQPLGGLDCTAVLTFSRQGPDRLTVEAVHAALERVRRHPALRAGCPDPDRFVDLDHPAPVPVRHDLLGVSAETAAASLATLVEERLHRPWDLAHGPGLGVDLLDVPDGQRIVLAFSLVVTDLAGVGVIARELARALTHPDRSTRPRVELAELGEALAAAPRAERAPAVDAAVPPPVALPPHTLVGAAAAPRMERWTHDIPRDEWNRLKPVAASAGVSPAGLVLAVFAAALERADTDPDGPGPRCLTVTGVDTRGSDEHVADRTRSYLVRVGSPLEASATDWVRAVGQELRARVRSGVDAEDELRLALRSGQHPGLSPFVLTHAADTVLFGPEVTDALGELVDVRSATPQVLIDCQVVGLTPEAVTLSFDARTDRLDPAVVGSLHTMVVEGLLRLIARGRLPERATDLVDLPRETQRARAALRTPPRFVDGLLHDDVVSRAEARPDAVAVIGETDGCGPCRAADRLTRGELLQAADRVASELVADGVARGDVVTVHLPKGPAQVVAVLGVLRAGATYLPLGIDQPAPRLERIRDVAAPSVEIDEEWLRTLWARPDRDEAVLPPRVDPDAAAYAIFTSGSTGQPKGVAVSHRAARNTLLDVVERHGVDEHDRVLAVSALDFDLAVFDVFGILGAGGVVVTIGEDQRRDAFAWADLARRHRVTVFNSVPGLAEMLCAAADPGALPDLRLVLCSGDWIDLGLPARLRTLTGGCTVVAMGGATEAAIWSNEYVVRSAVDENPSWPSIPYGRPLSGQSYRVIDAADRDRPDGVPGELEIGGAGVAIGYLHDPDRTAERFVTGADGTRRYRTGDLGVWREGLLFFCGRMDHQVKIRGHRIECGEVEATLLRCPGVERAVVVPVRERTALGALVVADDEDTVARARARVGSELPTAMVPTVWRRGDALPLTGNGKIDRRAVAALLDGAAVTDGATPTHGPADVVADAWRAELGDPVDPDTHFFAAGGDSLAATRVCARLRAEGVDVGVADLFTHPRLADFAACARAMSAPAAPTTPPEADPPATWPLTPLQRAYALGADGLRGTVRADPIFAAVLEADAPLDVDRVRTVLDDLVAEHEALRIVRVGETEQGVAPAGPVPVHVVSPDASVDELLDEAATPPGDLSRSPALRLVVPAGPTRRVALAVQYLALDATSLDALLASVVAALAPGAARPRLAPGVAAFRAACRTDEPTSPATALAPAPAPALRHRTSGERVLFGARRHRIEGPRRQHLEERAAADGVTVSALVLAALGRALGRVSGQDRMGVTVPVARRPTDGDHGGTLLGCFTRLASCAVGPGVATHQVQAALADALTGRAPDLTSLAAAGRATHGVVFTSTLGLTAQAGPDEVRVVAHRTSTPGVLLDCQLTTLDGAVEVRWDHPRGVLDETQLDTAWREFVADLEGGASPDDVGRDDTGTVDDPATLIGAALARVDTGGRSVRADLLGVHDAWRSLVTSTPPRTAPPVHPDDAEALAECLTGRRRTTTLLTHPRLAPAALLLDHPAARAEISRLAGLMAAHPSARPRVVELGGGSGLLRAAVERELGDRRAASLRWCAVECDALAADLAGERGVSTTTEPGPDPVDLVVAAATLHRDPRLLDVLARLRPAPGAVAWVLEPAHTTPASLLSAALLDPTVLTAAGPLHEADTWWTRLRERGWRVREVRDGGGPGQTLVAVATERSAPHVDTPREPAVARLDPTPAPTPGAATAHETVRRVWREELGLDRDPRDDEDFFALGGDSLRATRVLARLRADGFPAARLVDLFNAEDLDALAGVLGAPTPVVDGPPAAAPGPDGALTLVQQAYLAGRADDQILGGVSAHCYVEHEVDVTVSDLERAIDHLTTRHPALRTVIVDGRAMVLDAATWPLVEVVDDPRALTAAEVVDPTDHGPLTVRCTPGDGPRRVGIGMENLVLDGASMFTLLDELDALLDDPSTEDPDPDAAASDARRIARHLATHPWLTRPDDPGAAADRAHWEARLADLPPAPALVDAELLLTGPAATDTSVGRVARDLDAATWQRVVERATARRLTPAAVLLTAWARALGRESGQDALSVNVTLFDRPDELDGVLGDFTTLALVGAEIPPGTDLWTSAARWQEALVTAREHGRHSAVTVQRDLARRHGSPVAGMVPVVFTCGLGLAGRAGGPRALGPRIHARSQTPQTLVDLQVHDDADGLHLTADHRVALLAPARVERMLTAMVAELTADYSADAPDHATTDELQEAVARAWTTALDLDTVPTGCNFFRSGGDSLRATRCVTTLRRELGVDLPLRTLLGAPDFDDFVARVREHVANPGDLPTPTPGLEEGTL